MAKPVGPRTCNIIGSAVFLCFLLCKAWAAPVNANDHRAFWLWAGVDPQPALKTAEEIYILAGEVRDDENPHIINQRSASPKLKGPKLWVVYRAQTINWNEDIQSKILAKLDQWKTVGNDVAGLQIDFDAGTKNLQRYATFLTTVRTNLPAKYRLSITGLLDWSANGDPKGLAALGGVVDEVVLQIYQGRKVIPGYVSYLKKLNTLPIPFRIGLLQGGDWQAPESLEQHKYFRGYVVFLLNDAT